MSRERHQAESWDNFQDWFSERFGEVLRGSESGFEMAYKMNLEGDSEIGSDMDSVMGSRMDPDMSLRRHTYRRAQTSTSRSQAMVTIVAPVRIGKWVR